MLSTIKTTNHQVCQPNLQKVSSIVDIDTQLKHLINSQYINLFENVLISDTCVGTFIRDLVYLCQQFLGLVEGLSWFTKF